MHSTFLVLAPYLCGSCPSGSCPLPMWFLPMWFLPLTHVVLAHVVLAPYPCGSCPCGSCPLPMWFLPMWFLHLTHVVLAHVVFAPCHRGGFSSINIHSRNFTRHIHWHVWRKHFQIDNIKHLFTRFLFTRFKHFPGIKHQFLYTNTHLSN